MKTITIATMLCLGLYGCGSGESSMNQNEVKSFAPPKGAPRDATANKAIGDFKARFEATHGAVGNAPSSAQTPANH